MNYDTPESEPVKIEFTREKIDELRNGWVGPEDSSVDEITFTYVVHYLTPQQRINLMNECHRVLKKGGKVFVTVPNWSSNRAYGDLEVQWPPVVESWFPHLNRQWRIDNSIHGSYTCDFDFTYGYGMHPLLHTRNIEYQQHALTFWKEAGQDLIATMVKR